MELDRDLVRAWIVGILLTTLASCGFGAMYRDAMALTDRYYAAIGAGQTDAAASLYSPHFFTTTTRGQLVGLWVTLRERCGSPTAHKLITSTILNSTLSDTVRANVVFDVSYERCHTTERLSIVKAAGSESKIDAWTAQIAQPDPISPTALNPQSTTT
jgi:hypothetical protein